MELWAQIEESALSRSLRESFYLYPIIETAHVIGIFVFLGLVFTLDFYLLVRREPLQKVRTLIRRRYLVGSFVWMVTTGVLLFVTNPVRTAENIWFQAKVLFIALATVNAQAFYRGWFGRSTATRSFAFWIAVVVCGRWIAYTWPYELIRIVLECIHLVGLVLLGASLISGLWNRKGVISPLWGLTFLFTSGIWMYVGEMEDMNSSPAFRIKISLLLLACLFHGFIYVRRPDQRTNLTATALWLMVAVAGRSIGFS